MITVIADDLTGAAEVAGICLRYGLKVAFGIDSMPLKQADVFIIATDSRSKTEKKAFREHLQMTRKALSAKDSLLFKKTDSVLRGYIMAELEAMMQITGKSKVLFQPANPAIGRCIRNGVYYVNDSLLEKSGFSMDPDFPAHTSVVKELLTQRCTSKGTKLLSDNVIDVPDCNVSDDLGKILKTWNKNTLLAGSAAFFEQVLIMAFGLPKYSTSYKTKSFTNYLIVCGTTHPQSRDHLKRLEASDCLVRFFPENLLAEQCSDDDLYKWAQSLDLEWTRSHKMAIAFAPEKISFCNDAAILKMRMNKVVRHMVKNCTINELLIEGGATAYSIMNYLSWKTLAPQQELFPGVVRMQVMRMPSLHVTIKPGSYTWPSGIFNLTGKQ
ncbi:four-carbon acid sugar kinase family protein [Microbacter margulisiae]|uniref:Uncharacterized protein YgbK (DUF1537 family) n=1 Tax=Microbacter margulisiae TaxID=1350067 RepID=A0A7W5DQ80_9PORP|nr:four-carbon acid sugar kinase family protein [Microbacter margulisiae]MBB3186997.1 uncharacterized protein YgbK (DUF1537 family) [Microbacter margulisiae]